MLRIADKRKRDSGADVLTNVFRIAALNNDTVGDSLSVDWFAASLASLGFASIYGEFHNLVLDNFDPESVEIPVGVHFVVIGGNPDVGDRAKQMLAEKKLNPVLVDSSREFDSGFSVFMWVFKVSYFLPLISDIKDVLINPELLYECTDLSQCG